MRLSTWATLSLASIAAAAPARAQVPPPHPAPFVWQLPSQVLHPATGRPVDQRVRSSSCEEACSLAATIGVITGGIAGFYVGALRESHTGWPILIGAVAGGLTGAAIGRGFDDDTPKVDSTRVASP